MNGKPQAAREDGQGDLLDQIITQGLDKMKTPAQAVTVGKAPADKIPAAPKQENNGAAAPPADKKNRRSAVYLYLLILFGAAFMMLLLAYFVQQRSNEITISDLRDSMNLSREELLAEIKAMEEKNTALEEKNNTLDEELGRLNGELAQWQERYEEKDGEVTDLWNQLYAAQEELYSLKSFMQLEQFYLAKDYESCAALLILQGQGQYRYTTPDAAREEEIAQAVIDAGILDEDYTLHPDEFEDLLDAYFAEHSVDLLPIGC